MKRVLNFLLICLVAIITSLSFFGCSKQEGVVRIHIRANSNMENDQSIKLKVRDEIVGYITPLIAECENSEDVKNILNSNLLNIKACADSVLKEEGYGYESSVRLSNEFFPSRDYEGNTFPADYYDALIVELGSGVGDNWWCVAYPPLCFIGKDLGSDEIKYRSKLVDLINKFFS